MPVELSAISSLWAFVHLGVAGLTDEVRHIRASKITLKERRLNLTSIDGSSSHGVDCPDPVLIRRGENQLFLTRRGVDEGFGIPAFLWIVRLGPKDAEAC